MSFVSSLFPFIVEGLSRLIQKDKRDGNLKGVELSLILKITHFLFVDDVLLFGEGTFEEWKIYKSILDKFCRDSGMAISEVNLLSWNLDWIEEL